MADNLKKKQARELTIMILPEAGGDVRKITLSTGRQKLLKRLGLLSGMMIVALVAFSVLSIAYIPEFLTLRRDVALQKEKIAIGNHALTNLEERLERIRLFEQKIRVVLGQAPSVASSDLLGLGGPNREDLQFASMAHDDEYFGRMDARIRTSSIEGTLAEVGLQELHSLMEDQSSLLASTPSIWPVKGWLTSKFGNRTSPFTGLPSQHHGLDVAARLGTPIRSPADGIVTYVGILGGYGKVIMIDHGYDVTTRYGHLSEFSVKPGQRVRRGDTIGSVGNTGRSTAPHLHYEVRMRNVPVDPLKYILLD